MDLVDLLLQSDVGASCSRCCLHTGRVSVPRHLFIFAFVFFSNLLADGSFLVTHTKNIGTSLCQLLQTSLNSRAWGIDCLLIDLILDLSVSLLNPTRIQQSNSHVLLNFGSWNLLTSKWRDKQLVRSWWPCHLNSLFRIVTLLNHHFIRCWRQWWWLLHFTRWHGSRRSLLSSA